MPVTRERFAQGMTYDAYKAQMTRNRDRFDANEQAVELRSDDIAYFADLDGPLHVLVLAEDWCGDVIANLPVLGRLAAESGTFDMRVFLRDQNLDLIDQYLKDGQYRSIPVFVFFDAAFQELGHWSERPARMTELQSAMRRDLFANEPLLAGFAADTPIAQLPEEARPARDASKYHVSRRTPCAIQPRGRARDPCDCRAGHPAVRRNQAAGCSQSCWPEAACSSASHQPADQSQHHLLRRVRLRTANAGADIGADARLRLRASARSS